MMMLASNTSKSSAGRMGSPSARSAASSESITTSLKTWFYVIYLMGSTNSSLSAKRIQRETGVTYKTAWRTLRQIRRLLTSEDSQAVRPTMEMDNGDASGLREEGIGGLAHRQRERAVGSVG